MGARRPVKDDMQRTVEAMLAGLRPPDGERAVLAQMARSLAATLDGMSPSVSSRMAGQTHGQMLKVLDKLGGTRNGQHRDPAPDRRRDATPTPTEPDTDDEASWYPGFTDDLEAERLAGIIQKHARRRGLPLPGSEAYSRNPWAPDPWEYMEEMKERRLERRHPALP